VSDFYETSRWREEMRNRMGAGWLAQHDRGEIERLRGQQYVAIEFVCDRTARGRHKETVGVFGLNTFDGANDDVWMRKLPNGLLPLEAGRPVGQEKALMVCPVCGHEMQRSLADIRAQLMRMREPGIRRVVRERISKPA
jgi:hypothetical protein